VLYGDSYLRLDLPRVHEAFRASGLPALMTVLRNEGRWDKSNAEFDGERVTGYSKNEGNFEWIDYGLSILTQEVAEEIPNDEPADLADVFNRLSGEGRLAGLEVTDRFYEIGSPEGLEELERFLTSG
jgi:N-acetyl-alpha-D-muramate 1-phosphate uridylyltransferase